jgi:hypothetical protein
MYAPTSEKIKVFADAADLENQRLKTPFLFPLCGLPDWSGYQKAILNAGVFDKYTSQGKDFLQLVSSADCDCIVFPYDYQHDPKDAFYQERLTAYVQHEKQSGKPVVLFYSYDPEINRFIKDIPFANPLIFAYSAFRSSQPDNLKCMPAFIRDPLQDYGGKVAVREKGDKAVVGFCGFAAPLALPWGKYRLQEEIRLLMYRFNLLSILGKDAFHAPRAWAVKKILGSSRVVANFIVRTYSAFDSTSGIMGKTQTKSAADFRREYFDNIVSSDYVLCGRGNGNFSYRFYETLALGRIPVFVNTDSPLPFENQIDWNKYCVWVNENEIFRIDTIVQKFHEKVDKLQFTQLQIDCRILWEDYLSPEGFFTKSLPVTVSNEPV